MTDLGPDCVKTRNNDKRRGAKPFPNMPIAALRASGEAVFLHSILQSEFLHSLGRFPPLSDWLYEPRMNDRFGVNSCHAWVCSH